MATEVLTRPEVRRGLPPRRRSDVRRHRLAPFFFTGTTAVLFLIFFAWPGALGLMYSFTNYRGRGEAEFVGIENYSKLFADEAFYSAILRTIIFTIVTVPLIYVVSLAIALLLVSRYTRGTTGARMIFFMPWLISPIVTGVIWRWMFGESFGFINYVIAELGGPRVPWQTNANISLGVVVCAGVWAGTAFNMLLFMAALRNVPTSYYEAAELDGAGGWHRFRYITLPCIAPTSFMVILLATISTMKEFAMIQALNSGGPGTANNLIVQYIYRTGFERAKIGYASAASMVLMVILLIIALIQLQVNRRNQS